MKNIVCVLVTLITLITVEISASAEELFAIKPVLSVHGDMHSCGISVPWGETLEFSAADLERRLEFPGNTLEGVTVTALPSLEQGELVVDGVELEPYEYLTRQELDRLIFVPNEDAAFASWTLIPRAKGAAGATEIAISIVESLGEPPVAQDLYCETVSNIPIYKLMTNVAAPAGNDLRVQLAAQPQKGMVRFDGMQFTYTPYKDTSGSDQFTFFAIDSQSLYSNEATVIVNVEKTKEAFYYADMSGDTHAYAAIKLREAGIMSGSQIGGKSFFFPQKTLSRGEFLTILTAAGGLENALKPTVNTGLPDNTETPAHLRPYVRLAVECGVWPANKAFNGEESLTRAEAIALTGRVARLSSTGQISGLYNSTENPAEALTNSSAADLAWKLYKTGLR